MRHWIVALMVLPIFAVLAPELSSGLAARNTADWDKVKRLKQGSAIEVLLNDGRYLRGNFEGASDAAAEIAVADRNDPQATFTQEVQRDNIRRMVQVRVRRAPDLKRWMITGAVGGGLAGLVGGAVADGTHGTNYHWLEGGLGGALAGFFVSCVALAVADGVEATKGSRRTRVVYEDTSPNANSQPQPVSP
jgi:hypothetical protein